MIPPAANLYRATAPGSFPSNETICMLTVSCSCYLPKSPIKPHEQQRAVALVLLTFFVLGTRCLWMMFDKYLKIFICELSRWEIKSSQWALPVLLGESLLGTFPKNSIQDVQTGSHFPLMLLLLVWFLPGEVSSFPPLPQDSLSIAALYALPPQRLQPSLSRHTHTPAHSQSKLLFSPLRFLMSQRGHKILIVRFELLLKPLKVSR